MTKRKNHRSRSKRGSRSRQNGSGGVLAVSTQRSQPATWDPAVHDVSPLRAPRREPVITFRRTYTYASVQANTGDTLRAANFALSSLPNYTEYTALFDQYRVLEVVYSFMPYTTQSMPGSGVFPGIIGTWIDYDDANLPANLQEGQQYDTYQRNLCTEPFVRVVKPKSAVASYSGTFTSYDSVYGVWHDSSSPAIQHYGLKFAITGSTYATSTNVYEVEATVTIQCKSQH